MPLDRPRAPSPGVLQDAREALTAEPALASAELHWRVGTRMDRKRSTVFPLALVKSDGDVVATAFYKVPFFPDAGERPRRNLQRARAALVRSRDFGDRFARLAAGTGIQMNTTLAFDPKTLEIVTRGVEGRPMGNPMRHIWSRRRRSAAVEACRRIGRAVRLLHDFDVPDPDAERARIWGETERKLRSATSTLSIDELGALERHLAQLLDDAFGQDPPLTVAHGDLSPSNILIGPRSTGIIDFMWVPQLREFDLARFAHRIRFATLTPRRWTASLIDALLDGYGDRTAPDQPGWRFISLQRALATALRDPRGPGRISARRALGEIRSTL